MFVTANLPEGNVWPPSQNSLEEALTSGGNFFLHFSKISQIWIAYGTMIDFKPSLIGKSSVVFFQTKKCQG